MARRKPMSGREGDQRRQRPHPYAATRLKEEMQIRHLNQVQLAEMTKIEQGSLSHILSGRRTASPDTIRKLVQCLIPLEEQRWEEFLDNMLVLEQHSPAVFKVLYDPSLCDYLIEQINKKWVIRKLKPQDSSETKPPQRDVMIAARKEGLLRIWAKDISLPEMGICQGSVVVLERVDDETDLNPEDFILIYDPQEGAQFAKVKKGEHGELYVMEAFSPNRRGQSRRTPASGKRLEKLHTESYIIGRAIFVGKAPASSTATPKRTPVLREVLMGVAPFQDALLPVIGQRLGWFEEEGLKVACEPIDWYSPWAHFSKDEQFTIVFSNLFSFVNDWETDCKDSDLVFAYGVNVFHKGFALMAQDNKLETASKLAKERGVRPEQLSDEVIAQKVLKQLDNKVISTIRESDWAAQIYTLAQRFGLRLEMEHYKRPLHKPRGSKPNARIIMRDVGRRMGVALHPATIDRSAEFYLGSLPQRFRLQVDFDWVPLLEPENIPPPYPVNGFVIRRSDWQDHQDIFLSFLRVWFRIAKFLRFNTDEASRIVEQAFQDLFPTDDVAKLGVVEEKNGIVRNEIKEAWALELFPKNPKEVEKQILAKPTNVPYPPWVQDVTRAKEFLNTLREEITEVPNEAFIINEVHQAYISRFGEGGYKGYAEAKDLFQ